MKLRDCKTDPKEIKDRLTFLNNNYLTRHDRQSIREKASAFACTQIGSNSGVLTSCGMSRLSASIKGTMTAWLPVQEDARSKGTWSSSNMMKIREADHRSTSARCRCLGDRCSRNSKAGGTQQQPSLASICPASADSVPTERRSEMAAYWNWAGARDNYKTSQCFLPLGKNSSHWAGSEIDHQWHLKAITKSSTAIRKPGNKGTIQGLSNIADRHWSKPDCRIIPIQRLSVFDDIRDLFARPRSRTRGYKRPL